DDGRELMHETDIGWYAAVCVTNATDWNAISPAVGVARHESEQFREKRRNPCPVLSLDFNYLSSQPSLRRPSQSRRGQGPGSDSSGHVRPSRPPCSGERDAVPHFGADGPRSVAVPF